jgi:hypothetical protein
MNKIASPQLAGQKKFGLNKLFEQVQKVCSNKLSALKIFEQVKKQKWPKSMLYHSKKLARILLSSQSSRTN